MTLEASKASGWGQKATSWRAASTLSALRSVSFSRQKLCAVPDLDISAETLRIVRAKCGGTGGLDVPLIGVVSTTAESPRP